MASETQTLKVYPAVPESFEVDEPKSKPWELIEYLSYTIAGPDDLEWLLKMQILGRRMQRFDP